MRLIRDNAPSDNIWQGSWVGNNGTWTDGSATTSLSALAVRTSPAQYFPPFPGWLVFNQRYIIANSSLIAANNSAPISPCYPVIPPCPNCNPSFVATLNNIATNNIYNQPLRN